MIFLKPHWTAALTVQGRHNDWLAFNLSWIQGSIGDKLILQAHSVLTLEAFNPKGDKSAECQLRLTSSAPVGQLYVPVTSTILLGEKLPIHNPNQTFIKTMQEIEECLATSLNAAVLEFQQSRHFRDQIFSVVLDDVFSYMGKQDALLRMFNTSAAGLRAIAQMVGTPSHGLDNKKVTVNRNGYTELGSDIPF